MIKAGCWITGAADDNDDNDDDDDDDDDAKTFLAAQFFSKK